MVRQLDITITSALILTTIITGVLASSVRVEAEDITDVTDTASVTVPASCSMTATLESEHSASIPNGIYSGSSDYFPNGIGKTKIATFCNDNNGYAIYAIGFTGDKYDGEDHTKLIGATNGQKITTSTATSGDTSSWAMKLIKETDDTKSYNPTALTIENGYDNYNVIPNTYTKVANYTSTTDQTLGSVLSTTYATYISPTQVADTYTGKVKYTLVHPNTEVPSQPQTTETGKICYYANASDAVGTMGCQNVTDYAKDWSQCVHGTNYYSYCYDRDYNNIFGSLSSTDTSSFPLLASNFSRTGYGFAGWSNKFDYATNPEAKFYGPNETITLNTADYTGTNPGLLLYAVWVKSQGNLQDSTKVASVCNSLTQAPIDGTANLSSVSALTDQRDNNTYAIAKLADGKCWMIENMRLDNTNSDNSTGALAQGYATNATYGNFAGLANPETPWAVISTTANSLYSTDGSNNTTNIGTKDAAWRFPRYNNQNTASRASSQAADGSGNTYSYGNYYTWVAAIADLNNYTSNNASVTNTSICPTGWHLPKGGNNQNTANNEFLTFSEALIGAKPANYDSQTYPYYTGNPEGSNASNKLRSYPNNFLYSGYIDSDAVRARGSNSNYWSSTARSNSSAYYLTIYGLGSNPGTLSYYKYYGMPIRCLMGS